MNISITEDEDLLRQAAGGSEEAFTVLFRRHQGRVFRFALQMSGSRTLAEEVVQEVFLALLDGKTAFRPEHGGLAPYLLGIARKQVLRMIKRDRRYASTEEDGDESLEPADRASSEDSLDRLAREERIEGIRRAVLALPSNYREAVVLCDLQELDYVQAAQVMGCAVGTVRSRLHRGRALLSEKLRLVYELREAPGWKTSRCVL